MRKERTVTLDASHGLAGLTIRAPSPLAHSAEDWRAGHALRMTTHSTRAAGLEKLTRKGDSPDAMAFAWAYQLTGAIENQHECMQNDSLLPIPPRKRRPGSSQDLLALQ